MASLGRSGHKLKAFAPLFQIDVASTIRSKLVIAWAVASVFLGVIQILTSPQARTPNIFSEILGQFVYLWSFFVISLAAGAVSSEKGVLTDSILSKSVKRYEYVLSEICSRVVVLTVYFSITIVLFAIALRLAGESFNILGLTYALTAVALTLLVLTLLGVTVSVITQSTVLSFLALLVIWYSLNLVLPFLELQALSPAGMLAHLPEKISGTWSGDEWMVYAGYGALSAVLSSTAILIFETKDLP